MVEESEEVRTDRLEAAVHLVVVVKGVHEIIMFLAKGFGEPVGLSERLEHRAIFPNKRSGSGLHHDSDLPVAPRLLAP